MFEWGIGLRPQHFKEWLREETRPLFEILSDNYIYQKGGPALDCLDRLVSERPPLLHGIGLNIGGRDPIDKSYLERLKRLQARTGAVLISDHLCFCRGLGIETYDLLPLPHNQAELLRIEQRVNEVQDHLGQALCLENISAYLKFSDASMTDVEFLMELCHRTGCRILLDVNNLFVSCRNLGWDAAEQLTIIDVELVSAMHVSGYSLRGECLYDSHDQAVSDPVLDLLQMALDLGVNAPVILERDDADLNYGSLREEWERIQGRIVPGSIGPGRSSVSLSRNLHFKLPTADIADEVPQSKFLARLMSDLKLSPSSGQGLAVSPQSPDHWMVYVNGIIGRWTSLVDATVRRAAEVWGKPALVELLWEFASRFPPREADIHQSYRRLPLFVKDHPDFSRVSGLADLLESCFLYWDLMEGEDPCLASEQTQDPVMAQLAQPAILHRPWQPGLNLYRLWSESALRSTAKAELPWEALNREERALLLIKTTPSSVHVLPVAPDVYPLVEALVQGQSLADAVAVLAEQVEPAAEDRTENLLRETLEQLQNAGLLRKLPAITIAN